MDVLFITDSKYNNNYIVRKSAQLKKCGHDTFLKHNDPDKVIISGVFPQNKIDLKMVAEKYIEDNVEVEYGGTAFNLNCDPSIDRVFPDYYLYPSKYSIGHTLRGCPNNCYFCIVSEKEGRKPTRVQHVKDFWHPLHDTVMLLDSNILTNKDWFFENTDFIIDNNIKIWEHGLDLRFLDDEICQRIKQLKFIGKNPKFAFDDTRNKDKIIPKLEMLRKYKIKATVYIYCHDESCIPDAINRKEIVQKIGHDWHIMTNQDCEQTPILKDFKRWGCRPAISRSVNFEDYKKV